MDLLLLFHVNERKGKHCGRSDFKTFLVANVAFLSLRTLRETVSGIKLNFPEIREAHNTLMM
jgi:hypothetical protein